MVYPVIDAVDGTVVECNTAYPGERDTTDKHLELLKNHGWSEYFDVDLLDAEGPDIELEIPEGKHLKKNYIGKDSEDYDSVLVLAHFKGHPMGGFGGALKQLAIGLASSAGKDYVHTGGKGGDMFETPKEIFIESMGDAAKSIVDYFNDNLIYINVMKNLSVDCDCCAVAEDPCMHDIGILVSTDPVAIDQACVDLVYDSDDPGRDEMVERIESRKGKLILSAAEDLGVGSRDYELIEVE